LTSFWGLESASVGGNRTVRRQQNAPKVCNLLPHGNSFGAPAKRRMYVLDQMGGSVTGERKA
jgi:hypothetical protein